MVTAKKARYGKFCTSLFLTVALAFVVHMPAHSGGTGSGTVSFILPTAYGQVFFRTTNAQSQPACATQGWAFDLTGTFSNGGKAMLSTLLTALAAGKQVNIIGKGNCDVWSDRESVDYIIIMN